MSPRRQDAHRSIFDAPGVREELAKVVAAAPPATPAQVELVNRVFRRPAEDVETRRSA